MQVTKNEKIVKVVQEETYDIKGLTKAEAIALLLLLANSNGKYAYNIYCSLDKSLGMDNDVSERIGLYAPCIDLQSVQDKIEQLAQE